MVRVFGLLLLVVLGCAVPIGCGSTAAPPPLTPEQEQELEKQLEQASHAEGAYFGITQIQSLDTFEEGHVLLVGERVTAFNVLDANLGQTLADIELVLKRKADTFALSTGTERSVIHADCACHVGS